MKTAKLVAVLAIATVTGTAALAENLVPVVVTTAKGSQAQQFVLFRPCWDFSVALFTGGHRTHTTTTTAGSQK